MAQAQTLVLFASIAALLLASSVGGFAGTDAMHASSYAAQDESLELEEHTDAYLTHRRVLYDNRYVGYNTLGANKAACYGACPAGGQPYTGRNCLSIYRCPGQ